MTQVERLTVELMRLSVILERVEPRLECVDRRLAKLELRERWLTGAAAVIGVVAGVLAPVVVAALGF